MSKTKHTPLGRRVPVNKPLVSIGQIIKFHGYRTEVLDIKTQDGEYDYLLNPLDDINFCSGYMCGHGGCEKCEQSKYRSNWFLETEFKSGFKEGSNE